MKIKNKIALILSFIMLLSFAPPSLAIEYDSYKLELVANVTGYDLSDTEKVTRAQFAKLLAYAMTGGEISNNSKYFSDVSVASFAGPSISYLASMGIVAGDGTSFYPDRIITKNEAVKMLVMALGYNLPAEKQGGYFTGYLAVASRLKLLDNVGSEEELSGNAAMMLLYNTMHQYMLQETVFTENSIESSISDVTFLAAYRGIYKYTGKVNATAYVALNGYSPTERNAIIVGNKLIEKCPVEYDTLIGRRVDAYYQDNGTLDVVYIRDRSEDYKVYTAEEIDDNPAAHSSRHIKLAKSSQKINISQYADVIYNGRLIVTDGADFAFKDGYIEVVESGGTSGADLVIINSVEYKRVTSVNETLQVIYATGNNGAAQYDLANSLSASLTDENGMQLSLAEIVNGDLLEIMESRDLNTKDKIIRIKRVRNSFKGEIVSDDVNKYGLRLLGIDGKEYSVSRDFNGSTDCAKLKIGDYVLCYINSRGEIALVEFAEKSDVLYGYLLDAGSSGTMKKVYELMVFSQENKSEILELDEKVKFNGERTERADIITALFDGGSEAKQQMLKYSLNSDGKINTLYTAVSYNFDPDDETKKLKEYNGTDEFYGITGYKFRYTASQYILASNETGLEASFYPCDAVAYFNIVRPSSGGRITEDDIYASTVPHLVDGPSITCSLYDYGYSGSAKCVMSEINDRAYAMDYNLLLINRVVNGKDENGDDTARMYGYKKGQKIIYEPSRYFKLKYGTNAIKPGDIVIATYDRATFGLVEDYKLVYNPANNWASSRGIKNASNFFNSEAAIVGDAYSMDGAALCLDIGSAKYTVSTSYLTKYYYYDPVEAVYVPSTGSEICTLMESGTASRIVAKLRYGLCYDVVIFN